MMRAFWSGDNLANTVTLSNTSANSCSDIRSISAPKRICSTSNPTFSQMACVTFSLSPVKILVLTPCSSKALIAGAAEGFGGSKKAR